METRNHALIPKRRGQKQQPDPFCSSLILIYFTHTDLQSFLTLGLSPDSCICTLQIRDTQHVATWQISQHSSSCLAHSHADAGQEHFVHCITEYVHSPKAQPFCPSDAHKAPDFPTVSTLSLSLSLSFFCSSNLTNYQVQWTRLDDQPSFPSQKSPKMLPIQVVLHIKTSTAISFTPPTKTLLLLST